MNIITRLLITQLVISYAILGHAQGEAVDPLDNIEISILTCGPGDDIYSLFGHTALRVNDKNRNRDAVYNWGTFDYGEPTIEGRLKFTKNFLKGKLPYALSAYPFERFKKEYDYYQRSVDEQVLQLSSSEKKAIFDKLLINMQPQNRTYAYDFYFDNCVTRPRDIIEEATEGFSYPTLNDETTTFRGLLHENLKNHPWTQFGMDIVLGTQSEAKATAKHQMFLPDYYKRYIDESTTSSGPIVSQRNNILDFKNTSSSSWWTPLRLFIILLVVELIGFFLFYISGDRGFLYWFDGLWFIGLSICTLTFLFLWTSTAHTVCYNNWNLLWASPWVLLYFFKNKMVSDIGLYLTLLTSVIVLAGWSFIPQQYNLAIIPIVLVSTIKCIRLLRVSKWMDQIIRPVGVAVVFLCLSVQLSGQKIDGITMVAPPQEFKTDPMEDIQDVHADWVALVPFGFSRSGQARVSYGSKSQWWGERKEGIEASVKLAKGKDLKVMLKPQVWIPGAWVGEVDFDTEEDWKIWEDSYRSYIMSFIDIAIEYNVDLFCVGTEYRVAVKKREAFWRSLIKDIKKVYSGKLTYSSNWDSYDKVPIWDALDFVGISAYFPLTEVETPPTMMLTYRWNKHIKKLRKFSSKNDRKILFTEYGYLSVDGAAGKTWELEKEVRSLAINEQAQANGYEALFRSFWKEDFWAGGFLWKWFPDGHGHEGYPERDYTPQNKKAQKVLSEWYGKSE